jgi:hypothetical protein
MAKSAPRQANAESVTMASRQAGAISFIPYNCASRLCSHRALARLHTAFGVFSQRLTNYTTDDVSGAADIGRTRSWASVRASRASDVRFATCKSSAFSARKYVIRRMQPVAQRDALRRANNKASLVLHSLLISCSVTERSILPRVPDGSPMVALPGSY